MTAKADSMYVSAPQLAAARSRWRTTEAVYITHVGEQRRGGDAERNPGIDAGQLLHVRRLAEAA